MKRLVPLLALTLATALPLPAQTVIDLHHVDVGVGFAAGAFDLHVHDEESGAPGGTEFAPSAVILLANAASLTTSPGGAFSFLGPAGSSVYVLPQTRDLNVLWLGIGAEEVDPADFTGSLLFSLSAVSGPGNFSLWSNGSFGNPTLLMNTGDGISGADSISLTPGTHEHYNWGFTAPGDYLLTFQVEGTLAGGGNVFATENYLIRVVPEPSTYFAGAAALFAIGLTLAKRRPGLARPT